MGAVAAQRPALSKGRVPLAGSIAEVQVCIPGHCCLHRTECVEPRTGLGACSGGAQLADRVAAEAAQTCQPSCLQHCPLPLQSPDYLPEISQAHISQCLENLQKSPCKDLFSSCLQ